MNVYVKAHVSGNTALKHSTIANVIDVSNLRVKVEKPAPSIYTSQGKLKARPCDAIRSEEDIPAKNPSDFVIICYSLLEFQSASELAISSASRLKMYCTLMDTSLMNYWYLKARPVR